MKFTDIQEICLLRSSNVNACTQHLYTLAAGYIDAVNRQFSVKDRFILISLLEFTMKSSFIAI